MLLRSHLRSTRSSYPSASRAIARKGLFAIVEYQNGRSEQPWGAGLNYPNCPNWVCAVQRRRFPVGASPTRQSLQPEAIGAVMEGNEVAEAFD
jgi:hypothetical protein